MQIYVVIDTNVIVSSLMTKHSDSATIRVLEKVFDGTLKPVINGKILEEYRDVLFREKFNFLPEVVNSIINSIIDNAIFLDGIPSEEPVNDPKDVVFYEVVLDAQRGGSAYLVTGNGKHFPAKPFVVTPAQLLEIIEKN